MAMRAMILAALILAFSAPALAQETRRVDLYDKRSRRTGHAVINDKTGRVDLYDRKGRRTGYGKVGDGGRLELFDRKGRRVG